jgi:hypothetical protein
MLSVGHPGGRRNCQSWLITDNHPWRAHPQTSRQQLERDRAGDTRKLVKDRVAWRRRLGDFVWLGLCAQRAQFMDQHHWARAT